MMTSATIKKGFTLLETLVSLVLLGILLVTLNTFLFSMSELWGGGRDQRLFDQHVRAATRILKETLNQTTIGPGALGCTIKDITDVDGVVAPRLTFLLTDAGRLADWPEAPLPDVDFSLFVNTERGLILQWQSRLELERDLNDIHETILSPFVTSIAYDYFDGELKKWKSEEAPIRDTSGSAYLQPARLRIRYAHGNLKTETVIDIPIRRRGASRP